MNASVAIQTLPEAKDNEELIDLQIKKLKNKQVLTEEPLGDIE